MRYLWISLVSLFVLFSACNKESDSTEPSPEENILASWITDVDGINFEIDAALDQVMSTPFTQDEIASRNCPTRSMTPEDGSFPRTITLDFGDACPRPNELIFSGKIIIVITGPRGRPETQITRTFDEFRVNGVAFSGTMTRTFSEPRSYHQINNLIFTHPDGTTATFNSDHTVTQIEGMDTPQPMDDVFEVVGSSDGVTKEGMLFNATITLPLILRFQCPWPLEGIRAVEKGSRSFTLDYSPGIGRCNNLAIITLADGTTRRIRLDRRFK
jgi:hypothetical protein